MFSKHTFCISKNWLNLRIHYSSHYWNWNFSRINNTVKCTEYLILTVILLCIILNRVSLRKVILHRIIYYCFQMQHIYHECSVWRAKCHYPIGWHFFFYLLISEYFSKTFYLTNSFYWIFFLFISNVHFLIFFYLHSSPL